MSCISYGDADVYCNFMLDMFTSSAKTISVKIFTFIPNSYKSISTKIEGKRTRGKLNRKSWPSLSI